jgi:hypothetical protein
LLQVKILIIWWWNNLDGFSCLYINMELIILAITYCFSSIVSCGFYSQIQSNISSSCSFLMSRNAVWLVERCSNASFIYKFNGTAFNKLPLSIPFTSDCRSIRINAFSVIFHNVKFVILPTIACLVVMGILYLRRIAYLVTFPTVFYVTLQINALNVILAFLYLITFVIVLI